MKRRAAVEPVIGHTKAEHRMGRNYLKGRDGDRINAVLAAAGYNFGLLLRWLGRLLRALCRAMLTALPDSRTSNRPKQRPLSRSSRPTLESGADLVTVRREPPRAIAADGLVAAPVPHITSQLSREASDTS
jgi:hypothetical protein